MDVLILEASQHPEARALASTIRSIMALEHAAYLRARNAAARDRGVDAGAFAACRPKSAAYRFAAQKARQERAAWRHMRAGKAPVALRYAARKEAV